MMLSIEKVHEIYLHMLSVFDDICKKYDIKYHLDGGTLLGAIRHKGFIPWDDDIDISMTRENYDKLKSICNVELKKYDMVFVEPYDNKDNFHDFTSRIFYLKESYRDDDCFKNNFNGIFQYLWIDIFIYDKIDVKEKSMFFFKHKIIYGLAMGHRIKCNFDRSESIVLNVFAFILSIFGKFISLKKIYKWHKKLSIKYDNADVQYVYCGNGPIATLDYVDKLSEKTDIIYTEFENLKLPIIKGYDVYLKYYYGDYNILPPKDKQKPTHVNDFF